eukprot:gi/632959600/ref/XP_007895712.1/ PREDICTED: ATP-binding cassette sub-family A member 13 [Callorhinchus milii]
MDVMMTELKTAINQNSTPTCKEAVVMIQDVLNLPEEPFINEAWKVIPCGDLLPNDSWPVTEYFPSIKTWVQSVDLFQSGVTGQALPVTLPDVYRGWQEVAAAYQNTSRVYDHLILNITGKATSSPESWEKFTFSSFQEHLLLNLYVWAFHIFDAQGSAVERSDIWPNISLYIRGMCWVIENSNWKSINTLSGYGNISSSVCVTGKLKWRDLFNGTMVFIQNAGSSPGTVGNQVLKSALQFLDYQKMIKFSQSDMEILLQSFGNPSELFDCVHGLKIIAKVILENTLLWLKTPSHSTDESSSIIQGLLDLSQVNSVNFFIQRMKILLGQRPEGMSEQNWRTVELLLSVLQKELPGVVVTGPFQNTIGMSNMAWAVLQKLFVHNTTDTFKKTVNFFWNFTSIVSAGSTKAAVDYLDIYKMFLHYLNDVGLLSKQQASSTMDILLGLRNASEITSSTQGLSQLKDLESQLSNLLQTITEENEAQFLQIFYDVIHTVTQLSNESDLSSFVSAANQTSAVISNLFDQFSSDDIVQATQIVADIIYVYQNLSKEDLFRGLLGLYNFIQSQIQKQAQSTGSELQMINTTLAKLTEAFHGNTNNISCLILQALQSSSVPLSDSWLRSYCSTTNSSRKARSLTALSATAVSTDTSQIMYRYIVDEMLKILKADEGEEMALTSLLCTADLFQSWIQIVKQVAKELHIDSQIVDSLTIGVMGISQELDQMSNGTVCTTNCKTNTTEAVTVLVYNIMSISDLDFKDWYQMQSNFITILRYTASVAAPLPMDSDTFHKLMQTMENVFSSFQNSRSKTFSNLDVSKLIDSLQPFWSMDNPQHERLYFVLRTFANLNSSANLDTIRVMFNEIALFFHNSFNVDGLHQSIELMEKVWNLVNKNENNGSQFPCKDLVMLIKELIHLENPVTGTREWEKLLQWINILTQTEHSELSLSYLKDMFIILTSEVNLYEMDQMIIQTEKAIYKVLNMTRQSDGLNASDAYITDIISLLEMSFPDSVLNKTEIVQVLRIGSELAKAAFKDGSMSNEFQGWLIKHIQGIANDKAMAEELLAIFGKLSTTIFNSESLSSSATNSSLFSNYSLNWDSFLEIISYTNCGDTSEENCEKALFTNLLSHMFRQYLAIQPDGIASEWGKFASILLHQVSQTSQLSQTTLKLLTQSLNIFQHFVSGQRNSTDDISLIQLQRLTVILTSDWNIQQYSLFLHNLVYLLNESTDESLKPDKISADVLFNTFDIILCFREKDMHNNLSLSEVIDVLFPKAAVFSDLTSKNFSGQAANILSIKFRHALQQTVQSIQNSDQVLQQTCRSNLTMIQAYELLNQLTHYINNMTFNSNLNNTARENEVNEHIAYLERFTLSQIACVTDVLNSTTTLLMALQQIVGTDRIIDTHQVLQFVGPVSRLLQGLLDVLKMRNDTTAAVQAFMTLRNESSYLSIVQDIGVKRVLSMTDELFEYHAAKKGSSKDSFFQQLALCIHFLAEMFEAVGIPHGVTENLENVGKVLQIFDSHAKGNSMKGLPTDSVFNITYFALQNIDSLSEINSEIQLLKTSLQDMLHIITQKGTSSNLTIERLNELIALVENIATGQISGSVNDTFQYHLSFDSVVQIVQHAREIVPFLGKEPPSSVLSIEAAEMFLQLLYNNLPQFNYHSSNTSGEFSSNSWIPVFSNELVDRLIHLFLKDFMQFSSNPTSDQIKITQNMTCIIQNLLSTTDEHLVLTTLKHINGSLAKIFEHDITVKDIDTIMDLLTQEAGFFTYMPQVQSLIEILTTVRTVLLVAGEKHFPIVLHTIPDGVAVIQDLSTNVTEAFEEVYRFAQSHQTNWSVYSHKNMTEVNEKIIKIMQLVAGLVTNAPEMAQCFPLVVCKLLSEEATNSNLLQEACNLQNPGLSAAFNSLAADIKRLLMGTTHDSANVQCENDTIPKEIFQNMVCLHHQYEEWIRVLLRISQVYNLERSGLEKLQAVWVNISYIITSTNITDLSCPIEPVIQATEQLLDLIGNKTSEKILFSDQFITFLSNDDLFLLTSINMSANAQRIIETLASYFQYMTENNSSLSESKKYISTLISTVQSLISVSGNEEETVYKVLSDLLYLLKENINTADILEGLGENISKILSVPEVKQQISAVERLFHLLRNITLISTKESSSIIPSLLSKFDVLQLDSVLNNLEELLKAMEHISNFTDAHYHKLLNVAGYLLANQNHSKAAVQMAIKLVESASLVGNMSQLLLEEKDTAISVFTVYQQAVSYITTTLSEENFKQGGQNLQILNDLILEFYSRWDHPPKFQQAVLNKIILFATTLNEQMPTSNNQAIHSMQFIANGILKLLEIDTNGKVNLSEIRNVTVSLMNLLEEYLEVMQVPALIRNATANIFEAMTIQLILAELSIAEDFNQRSWTETCKLYLDGSSEYEILQYKMIQLQIRLLNLISDKKYFVNDIMCMMKDCRGNISSSLVHALTELSNFTIDVKQAILEIFSSPVNNDCEGFQQAYFKLQMTMNQTVTAVSYAIKNYKCECKLTPSMTVHLFERVQASFKCLSINNTFVALLENFEAISDLPITKCLRNITILKMQLQAVSPLSLSTIDALLGAHIFSSKLIVGILAGTLTCNKENLALMLSFSGTVNLTSLADEVCSLTGTEAYEVIVRISEYMEVRCIIYEVVLPIVMTPDVNQMMQRLLTVLSGITSLTEKFRPLLNFIPELLQTFKNLNLPTIPEFQDSLERTRAQISTESTFQTFSQVICSKKSSRLFSDNMMFSELPQIKELSEEDFDKYKIPRNATPYCSQFYQDILKSPNGALVWTFMKPLLLGEIPYAPNTPEVQNIIEKANKTISMAGDLKIYSEVWLQLSDIFKHQGKSLMFSQIQDALQSSFVNSFIQTQLDIDLQQLLQDVEFYEMTLDNMLNDPVTKQITLLSQLMVNVSSCILMDRFRPLESKEALEHQAQGLMSDNTFLASVFFAVDDNNTSRKSRALSSPLPPQMKYTIRTSILHSMPTDIKKNPQWKAKPKKLPTASFRYNRIFIPLQDMIERAIIQMQTGQDVPNPAVQVQGMPYPCHKNDKFLNNIGFFFPLIMMMAWLVSVAAMVRNLVHERELRLEEYMKMMGVQPITHFIAWFLENAIVLIVSSAILTIIFKASHILPNSNGFIIFLYMVDFGVSVIAMSYLIAAFFSRANTAALSASLFYIITFFPYMVLVALQNQLIFSSQILICLLCATAFSQGAYIITILEGDETGIQWHNMYEFAVDGQNLSFAWICWIMVIDTMIYFVIGWYLRNIFPGKYGTRKPWYFPFTATFWKNLFGCKKIFETKLGDGYWVSNLQQYQTDTKGDPISFQHKHGKEDENLKIGVALRSLTKEYKHGKKVAVKDLNLNFLKGEITTLLGPNGAGKTTTMSLLTGMHQPTSGTVYVNGKNMSQDLLAIRKEMGVCLQYDVLFESLTVHQHLKLYGSIKAPQWTKEQLLQEIKRALEDVGITEHQHKRVGALSGGTKRKLSIAISFIGGSSTVILDEPTSGVDPCSRRAIWDVILKYKDDRTIILTTHHLDEAELLSDQIAILESGQLKCCGSPTYLKELYGQGYSLRISPKPSPAGSNGSFDSGLVTSLVREHVPTAFLKEDSLRELTYVIPTIEDKTAYEHLFQALDEKMEQLHISSYSISDTTLEEAFLNLLENERKPTPHPSQDTVSLSSESTESNYSDSTILTGSQRVTGIRLCFKQMAALLIKRFHHTRRDWKGAIANLLLPVLFVTLAMALFSVKPLAVDYPSLRLSTDTYENSDVVFFSSDGNDPQNITSVLLNSFKVDNSCARDPDPLKTSSCWWSGPSDPQDFVGQCSCTTGNQECPALNTTIPHFINKEKQYLYDLTGYDIEEYLISTVNSFAEKRLGGWSFGMQLPPDLKQGNFSSLQISSLVKVWYNQLGFHAEPAYLNKLNNLLLWANLPPGTDWTQYGITVYSHPYRGSVLDDDSIMENLRQCGVAFCILIGFSVLTASIGTYIIRDRVTGQKRIQHISGLSYWLYWLTNFLYDMVYYLVPVTLCIAIIAAFRFAAFTSQVNLGATYLLLLLFGFATLPWMYLLSRFFSSSDAAFITYIAINLVLGLCTILTAYLPRFIALLSNQEDLLRTYTVLRWVFIVFPPFCLAYGLIELSYNQLKFDLTQAFGVDSYVSPFEMEFLGWTFVALTVQGCVLFSIRLLFQGDFLHKIRFKNSADDSVDSGGDEDVKKECERVLSGRENNDILQLHNVKKKYKTLRTNVTAVKGVTVGIPRGECFGLLGVNGAGKTTTFKMLTGDIGPSSGHAVVKTAAGSEQDIMNLRTDGTLIGYCPQYDALDDLLTGWEHLYFYCRIRGLPEKMISKHMHDLTQHLYLTSHVNKLVKTYSGGTKRKLSTAIALIGKPAVLLLDEPSSGMDPESKRYLWKTIIREVETGCAAVLTSHSMEECEALCTRLAIMVNGTFKCLGSPHQIKYRFGAVYSVKVRLSREVADSTQLTDLLHLEFPGASLKEQHQSSLEFQVPQKKGDLAKMVKFLESNKQELKIDHYSISQTTLDQVFINFARQLEEPLDLTENTETNPLV